MKSKIERLSFNEKIVFRGKGTYICILMSLLFQLCLYSIKKYRI